MGDLKTLAKARMELEELYLGIPDDSVNLTFQDLADVNQKANTAPDKKKPTTNTEPIQEAKTPKQGSSLTKLPSLDFNRGLQASREFQHHHNHHHLDHINERDTVDSHRGHHRYHHHDGEGLHATMGHQHGHGDQSHHHSHAVSPRSREFRHAVESSMAYDDVSVMSMASNYTDRGQRRRPGIPHSNICTVCSTYIYIFRHRCLVCGRVYCRQCVSVGMGELTEGRKCIQCLGKKFSARYIQRAGMVSCCAGYPTKVKQAELKWAEKGPRKTGERGFGHIAMMSGSRSPMTPRTTTRAHPGSNTPSFVATPSYSPYTPTHHHLPL